MRQEFIEKPPIVKELAHMFTYHMCCYKQVPAFLLNSKDYQRLIDTHEEYANKVELVGMCSEGGYGKAFGVEFAVMLYDGPSSAVDQWTPAFTKIKEAVLKEMKE